MTNNGTQIIKVSELTVNAKVINRDGKFLIVRSIQRGETHIGIRFSGQNRATLIPNNAVVRIAN